MPSGRTAIVSEKVITAFREMCESQDRAPSPSAVSDYLEKRRSGVSRQYIADILMIESEMGRCERKKIGQYSFYRIPGLRAQFPKDYDVIIENAVVDFNRSGKMPNGKEIAEKAGCSQDTSTKVLKRLGKYPRNSVKAVRVPGARNIYIYVSTRPEFKALYAETKLVEKAPHVGSGITPGERIFARAKTLPGDVIETTAGKKVVLSVCPHICVFTDGDSVRWADMAVYYRNKKPIALESRCSHD